MKKEIHTPYCEDILNRKRFPTHNVQIGSLSLGGKSPVRVQSMTTTDTLDTNGSVEQSIRMIEAGCELVRLTAPSIKDAENLANIKQILRERGYKAPLVADIHFTPNAAEVAAKIVEKVRVNPGNYADKKKFENIEYTDETYQQEIDRIEEKFTPLVQLCKANGTAMRIGTNHGSLSDRILSRYGDTPEGMVESAMEFLRICVKNDYHDLVLSMKASNTIVMVQAYRLLVATMKENGMNYPLHLGVTEAGDGEDGRIKSAVGIGALLEDGIGDTIRVSLTEDPEAEIPVAQKLLEKFTSEPSEMLHVKHSIPYDPYAYHRRVSTDLGRIGGHHVPVVMADLSAVELIKHSHFFGFGYQYSVPLDKWNITDTAADIVYIGQQKIDFELPGTVLVAVDYLVWKQFYDQKSGYIPVFTKEECITQNHNGLCLVFQDAKDDDFNYLINSPNAVLVLKSRQSNTTHLYRRAYIELEAQGIHNPVILQSHQATEDVERFQLWTSSELGSLFIDGFGDGIWLSGHSSTQLINSTAFGILQATRTRISKTEYISCPSCGRTLFDLQETTAKIRAKTSHLKGVKIGIMGCIVNGPGEMADADYGYVGTRPGKIHLYREQEVVRKNVDESEAVEALIDLIKEHGDWVDPVE